MLGNSKECIGNIMIRNYFRDLISAIIDYKVEYLLDSYDLSSYRVARYLIPTYITPLDPTAIHNNIKFDVKLVDSRYWLLLECDPSFH